MKYILKKIFQNHSTRVLVLLFFSLILLIGYFLTHSYFVQLDIHKTKILTRLEAVATTASLQLDGNQLEYLQISYEKENAIMTNHQDRIYQLLHEALLEIKELNNLNTSIYTLFREDGSFYFGVNSESKPYFRYEYEHFPKELETNYKVGGSVDVYEDENGYWLSAFAPISNSEGKVIAVVQVDNRFNEFLAQAREEIFINIGISLFFMLFFIFFLIRSMRSILVQEDQLNAELMQSKLELEQKSKETLDSIIYAKRIQEAILPLKERIVESLPESFVFHLPRDIVSGDFYWFKRIDNKIFIASVDCTGHGVPGAFMSMIGAVLLDDIVEKKGVYEPDQILTELHKDVVKSLKQDRKEKASKDGMDIALCVFDTEFKILKFAGAFRPLIHISDGVMNRIKADSAPIGGVGAHTPKFTQHKINIKKGDSIYIYTDGFADQFGGERNKKYMTKRFREFLLSISDFPIQEQQIMLKTELDQWQGVAEQVDDILVIGIKI
jgi:serine phosphatase RsbU (regulator of sigma subunit)